MTDDTSRPVPPGTLKIIRLAFLTGVLILGVVGYFLAAESDGAVLDEDTGELLTYVFFAVALGALGLLTLLRRRRESTSEARQQTGLAIAGYAIGDGVAIFGFVFILLTGSFVPYLLGVLIFLMAFLMFPPDV